MEDDDSKQPESDMRDRTLRFIHDNPVCHLPKIKDELDVGMGTVQYHLDKLEKAGRITPQKQSLHKYYFLVGVFEENEKHMLEALSNETAREILMFIIEQQYPSQ